MEVELVTESMSEEAFGVDDNIDEYSTFEGERCGICMDTVIDRGVLDCCQHWFCFTCIDNWATITNLCPLCQSEFQLITCVPVYDTIGSNRVDEELYSRDDDWCIEGKNNTLSFPSYYIDENAVICLDGDGCKIRCGSATMAEDCTLDTSIACDSCDIWYHALCVGFDPEGTCENSWLCPRCVVNGMPEKIEMILTAKPDASCCPENANSDGLADVSFSGKVSVAVADAGETAVVISMVGGNHSVEEPVGNISSTLDVDNSLSADAEKSQSTADDCKLGRAMSEIGPIFEKSIKLSLSQETSFSSPSRLLTEQRENSAARGISEMTDGLQHSSRKLFLDDDDMSLKLGLDLHLGLSVGSCLSDLKNNNSQTAGDVHHEHRSEELLLTVGKIPDEKDNIVGTAGTRRKHGDRSADDGETKAETETKISRKRFKAESSRLIQSNDEAAEFVSDDSWKFAHLVADFKDGKPRHTSEKDAVSTDIMDIVRGPDCKALRRAQANAGAMSSKEENAAGLRIKKIMRRSAEDTESSTLVQKLRKEIREAVRNKSSKEFGERLFDPKLLAAFRAAVTGPINETPKSLPVDMKAKKLLLQKGKVRENLTKKIYGISGRRKRAWTRDCEIEFWKHRCLKISKPQKIETLRSVLNVLRKGPESLEIKQGNEGESTNSILSRLYLADTSVFPRKDDIKPLSSFHASENKVENKAENPMRKSYPPFLGNHFAKTPSAQVSNNKMIKGTVPSSKDEASCSKVDQNKSTEPSSSKLGSSKTNSQDTSGKSDDIRSNKRKWALEVLARKSAVTSKNAVEEKQDSILQKGNYPLLAQLPADMRPVLAPSHHNKIPMSIRQAQLYRLTEHFLKKANLPVVRRTAKTELAVADAVNIEREVADRSNSKLVYVNLCSQELLHRSDHKKDTTTNTNPSSTSVVSPEQLEVASVDLCSDAGVEEALRNAGLLPDSPPNSPHNQVEEIKADVDTSKKLEPDDVFEMDPHPELDIYGDFEYDLEDEYFMGAGAFKTSRQQPEGESKMKVVFSTVNSDSLNGHLGFDNHESLETMDESNTSSSLLHGHESTMENILPHTSSLDEEGEEPSSAECEELYGPDKEPLFDKFEGTSTKVSELAANIIDLARNEGGKFDQGVCSVGPILNHCAENLNGAIVNHHGGSPNPYGTSENAPGNEKCSDQKSESDSVPKKVEAYIKEHIRPLCKSGVITVEQYRWAVGKTTDKVMKYHSKDKSAKFLIKEGEKVKKLAEQYVEAAQQMGKNE